MTARRPICVDIDNVIGRTDEVIRDIIRQRSAQRVDLQYQDVVEFDYWKCVDQHGRRLERSEWEAVHDEFTANVRRVEPYENVQTYLARLQESFEIYLVTSRKPSGDEDTRQWLRKHRIPFDDIKFAEHRKKHLRPEPFVLAIEDDREQAQMFQERGVKCFLLAHPWNTIAAESDLTRIAAWPELVRDILARREL